MPSIVGPIKINSVAGGVVNFGDSFYVSPKSTAKAATGSGGNVADPDVGDSTVTANA